MIKIGEYNELEILRETSVGLFLGDEEGEDVLLPNKYCPGKFEIGDKLKVFVYLDYEERKIATDIIPKIYLNEFALLEVADVSNVGAFLDWGMEKHLLVPFKEQRQKMIVGRWYVVYLALDEKTDRLFASNRIEKWLSNEELTVAQGDEVEIVVYRETEIGFSVIVNHQHRGLIYENEVFEEIRIGDKRKAYVKKIQADNKLDIALQPPGYEKSITPNVEEVYKTLQDNNGFMPVTDKSPPELIYQQFGMSKKSFKKAVGALYKERKITIQSDGIKIVGDE
ncbi:MAG: S1-like domain-containing RNA-binding protein [Bacteroidota bacterium]